jgi:hypothetical protein
VPGGAAAAATEESPPPLKPSGLAAVAAAAAEKCRQLVAGWGWKRGGQEGQGPAGTRGAAKEEPVSRHVSSVVPLVSVMPYPPCAVARC